MENSKIRKINLFKMNKKGQEFRHFIVGFLLAGLFIYAMLSFALQSQTDNSVGNKLINNQLINRTYSSLGGNLSSSETLATSSKGTFENETPTASFGSANLFSIKGIAQTIITMITAIYNVTIGLAADVFGVDRVVILVLASILIFVGIFMIWRWVRFAD